MLKARLLCAALLGALVYAQPADIEASSLSRLAKKYWKPVVALTTVAAAAGFLWNYRNFNGDGYRLIDEELRSFREPGKIQDDYTYNVYSKRLFWWRAENAIDQTIQDIQRQLLGLTGQHYNVTQLSTSPSDLIFSYAARTVKLSKA